MVDTFTGSLRLRKPEVAANEDTWGPLLNDDMTALLEAGVAGVTVVDVTAADVVLTVVNGGVDEARAMILRVIGTPPFVRIVDAPNVSKLYFILNESSEEVFIRFGVSIQVVNPGQNTTLFNSPGGIPQILTIDQDTGVSQPNTITDPQSPNDTFTFNIPAANGGAGTSVAVEHLETGEFVYINIATMMDVNFNSVNMDLVISAGVIPTDIRPAEPQYIPVSFWEDTGGGWVYTPAVLRITDASATTWSILQIDGTTFTNTSDRAWMYNISTLYPKTGIV